MTMAAAMLSHGGRLWGDCNDNDVAGKEMVVEEDDGRLQACNHKISWLAHHQYNLGVVN